MAYPTFIPVTCRCNDGVYQMCFQNSKQGLRPALMPFKTNIRMATEEDTNGQPSRARKQVSGVAQRKPRPGSAPIGKCCLLKIADTVQQLPGLCQKQSRMRGWLGSTCCPVEQPEPQLIFEPCNLTAERRLLDIEPASSPRETALLRSGHNIGKMIKVNHARTYCKTADGDEERWRPWFERVSPRSNPCQAADLKKSCFGAVGGACSCYPP